MTAYTNHNDRYGLPISSASLKAIDHYAEGLDLTLAQNFGAEEEFVKALEADQGFAIAHAALGFHQFMRVAVPEAKASAATAVELSSGITPRERRNIQIISKFVNGENHQAIAAIIEHLKEFPRDALLLRLAQRLYIQGCSVSGVLDYPPLFYKLMKDLEPEYGEDWAFMGQFAWANHEVGLMEEGLNLAERSLDLKPTNAVAAHSVGHVFFETNRNEEGAAFLGSWLDDYDRRAAYRVHLSWHQALFELAMGRYNQALAWYQTDIRPSVQEKKYASLADSASLIWRMHIYGDIVPRAPWEELIELAAPAAANPGPPFRDAHAALAFTAAGDDASFAKLVCGLQVMADKGDSCAKEATLPLVMGVRAFGNGDYLEAARLMGPVHHQLTRIGGSHAQRQVFEDTLLEAYLRAEQFDQATALLRERLGRRETPRDTYWLARAQVGSGHAAAAQLSLKQAKAGWERADADTPEFTEVTRMSEILDK